MTKFQLMTAFFNLSPVWIGNKYGVIQEIQLEDGSGHNFNVTLNHSVMDAGGKFTCVKDTVFMRTID